MNVLIRDDFDLQKIINSGQCFRAVEIKPGLFRFMSGRHVLYISQNRGIHYEISCSKYVWNHVWKPYFDLFFDYEALRRKIPTGDTFLTKAADYSKGIRILNQDPWEMLITFIISQRKSIPAIRTSVEKLCGKAGQKIETPFESLYTFPTPKALSALSPDDLRDCSLGYRTPYIYETTRLIRKYPHLLKEMDHFPDEELVSKLMELPGVGIKVADCTALFGYHRTGLAPVDVWIQRVIDTCYCGNNPFPVFGKDAGIIQQYLFYYAQTTKLKR